MARRILPDAFSRLFAATEESLIQAIHERSVPRMAFGRACLTGEAAFLPLPHAAASTTKAATNAAELARIAGTHSGGDVATMLKEWEPEQVKLGERLVAYAKSLGDRSQFGQ